MRISVTDPLSNAFAWVKQVLFVNFSLSKWFVLGFCAFLAQLGQGGGGGGNFNFGNSFSHHSGPGGSEVSNWISQNIALIVTVGLIILILGISLGLLFTWLSSRGQFMFLDGVVRNQPAVKEPWHRFRSLGNSLFLCRIVLGIIGLAAILIVIGTSLLIALPDIKAEEFGPFAIIAIIFGGLLFLPLVIILALIKSAILDFVVLIMYYRNIKIRQALKIFRREILPGHLGIFILFYLFKFVLGIAAGTIIILGMCLTCCIAILPYISSVVFLPISVFFRAYSLFFLEQFGPQWRGIEIPPKQTPPLQP
ncbi:MAG: hypothetical protein JXD22_06640 [Sedimentisphaerales bacterium]|nr:hypothetical protein [Sedimentisphaerales bacterium]